MQYISITELKNRLSSPNAPILIDIRSPQDYSVGHIEHAENLFFYSPQYKSRIAELQKDFAYVIYCSTECRSQEVVEDLNRLGIKEVSILNGGYNAWVGGEASDLSCSTN